MGDVGRGFRPIAPRTLPPGGGEGSQSPLGNSGGGQPEDGRMKRASTACKECQKRRTRCSGPPICSECSQHNKECTFDEQADRRRKANARRTQEELATLTIFTDQLLKVIREYDGASIQRIIDKIRSSASREEIQAELDLILNRPPQEFPQPSLAQPSFPLPLHPQPQSHQHPLQHPRQHPHAHPHPHGSPHPHQQHPLSLAPPSQVSSDFHQHNPHPYYDQR
ncbi:hypothetical protein N7539_000829 [Penicillium diatomitis]|uniref:Zn(2)-C6 fungal-type domain-containing protein n=1 Tax=Penicillium diatomitis TaxID=2819901 RepID=A0A9X0C2J4_9EURO|nr:uncharacterized protein N7539_000829 [Penicillium diatomitis]KAJ5495713.1 hypothetical protein N7539_000829 [Penicillium diatomitis]